MDLYWKTIAGVLISAVLATQFAKRESETAILLRTVCCTMAAFIVFSFLHPVLDFFVLLEDIGGLKSDILLILLKSLGIGITTDLAANICSDAGSASLGKTLNYLGTAVILYLSLPVFKNLITIILQITGDT